MTHVRGPRDRPGRGRGGVRGLPSRASHGALRTRRAGAGPNVRVGETIWRFEQGGDGGGVAFDQVVTHRYVTQHTDTDWSNGPQPTAATSAPRRCQLQEGGRRSGSLRPGDDRERRAPTTAHSGDQPGLVHERLGCALGHAAEQGQQPRAGGVNNAQDALPAEHGGIRVLRWATVDHLWLLSKQGFCASIQRDPAGRWTASTDVSLEDVLHPAKSTDVASSDAANDIAVHEPSRGPVRLALPFALLGDLSTDDDDTLWWWDGSSTWHKTGLASTTTAAALAVAVEPGHLDTVYVGTAVGCSGPRSPSTATHLRGRPGPGSTTASPTSPCRTSRSSRRVRSGSYGPPPRPAGSGELDLAGPVTDRTYVRVHQDDTRRTLPTPLVAPFEPKIADPADATRQIDTTYRWHASPDLRVHPKLGPMAAPTSLPWTRAHPAGAGTADRFGSWRLWRLQTALRHDDPRSRPNGVWDDTLDTVLRANGVPTPGGVPTITKAYWESKVTGANLHQLPSDTPAALRGRPRRAPPRRGRGRSTFAGRAYSSSGVLDTPKCAPPPGTAPAASSDLQSALLYRVVAAGRRGPRPSTRSPAPSVGPPRSPRFSPTAPPRRCRPVCSSPTPARRDIRRLTRSPPAPRPSPPST